MQYIKKNNWSISRIGLGSWVFGKTNWGQVSDKESVNVINTAIDLGIKLIDTAPIYGFGHAESIIGKTIKPSRDNIILATKCGLRKTNKGIIHDLSNNFIIKECENSLKRLQADVIDLYQCHWPDSTTPLEETAEALRQLLSQGKIKNIGLCNFSVDQIEKMQKLLPLTSLQFQHSLLKPNQESMEYAINKQLISLTYGTLHGGLLTGKYTNPPQESPKTAKSFFYDINNQEQWNKTQKIINEFALKAAENNSTITAEILDYNIKQEVTSTLIGCRNTKQLLQNIKML